PQGVKVLPEIVDKARLQQARVTKELRVQAREAVERFIQEILDHPENRDWFDAQPDTAALAKALWHEGLITIYRLLFILKLESSDDPARSYGFASMSLSRNTFSPSMALGTYARDVLERGLETGRLLESGLRSLFRMFELGLQCTEMVVKPLGGKLFGPEATPLLTERVWGERAVAAGRSSKWSSHWRKGRSTDPPVPSTKCRPRMTKPKTRISTSMMVRNRTGEARRRRFSGSRRFPPTGSICESASDGKRAAPITRPIPSFGSWYRRRLGRRSKSVAHRMIRSRSRSSSSRFSIRP